MITAQRIETTYSNKNTTVIEGIRYNKLSKEIKQIKEVKKIKLTWKSNQWKNEDKTNKQQI